MKESAAAATEKQSEPQTKCVGGKSCNTGNHSNPQCQCTTGVTAETLTYIEVTETKNTREKIHQTDHEHQLWLELATTVPAVDNKSSKNSKNRNTNSRQKRKEK